MFGVDAANESAVIVHYDISVRFDLLIFLVEKQRIAVNFIFFSINMDTAQYLDVLVAEKDSLDPSYHPNAVRLLTEGKKAPYFGIFQSEVCYCFNKSMPHVLRQVVKISVSFL
jgi:hypothetical protein